MSDDHAPGSGAVGSGLTVMVVDDHLDSAESLAALLELLGHQVVAVAHDGVSAVALIQTHRPRVVLLDVALPGLSGIEVARRIREDPGLADTALVAVTGFGDSDDRDRMARAGFDRHLVKPLRMESLRGVFESLGG